MNWFYEIKTYGTMTIVIYPYVDRFTIVTNFQLFKALS